MSVINKMLRDLDSRQATGAPPDQAPQSRTGIASSTAIITDPDGAGQHRILLRLTYLIAVAVVVLVGVAGAWWYLNKNKYLSRNVDQLKLASTVKTSKPIAEAPAGESVVVVGPVRVVVAPDEVPPMAAIEKPPAVANVPVVEPLAALAAISLRMDNTFKLTSIPSPSSRPDATRSVQPVPERSKNERPVALRQSTPAAVMPATQSAPRRSPVLDALAQAQSLWSAGSHEAAIDLLHDALAAAERGNLARTSAGNNSLLASLARELARMELAQGRAGPALEMLTRLEPALSGFADVWALRGNAAQRLGRHQESADAYLMALKLRPDEPRWMLGAAVSLAAQGQTSKASELTEKARVGGVLSPEVAAYLRQLGVTVRER